MFKWLLFVFLVFAPGQVLASVLINEIAWMGNSNSANDEWIELYNSSSQEIIIDGWRLRADDGSPDISLSDSIGPGEYFLLERSDDTSAAPIASQIYTGGMNNTGENLTLIDTTGAVVDSATFSSGWPAGDNVTKETMQRNGSVWITGTPTPKAENSIFEESETTEDAGTEITMTSNNSETEYVTDVNVPKTGIVGVPINLYGVVTKEGSKQRKGVYTWNFGDGEYKTYSGKESSFYLEHTYTTPGVYAVFFEYRTNNFTNEDPHAAFRSKIQIVEPSILFSRIDYKGVVLENKTNQDVDLGEWSIRQGNEIFTFPSETTVLNGASIGISRQTLGFTPQKDLVMLMRPDRSIVKTFTMSSSTATTVKQPSTSSNVIKTVQELPEDRLDFYSSKKSPLVPLVFGIISFIFGFVIIRQRLRPERAEAENSDDRFEYIKILEE